MLILHPALAPYRIDLFNALARRTELLLVLLHSQPREQAFDQETLRGRLSFDSILSAGAQSMPVVVRSAWTHIKECDPDVVIVSEYSPVSLAVVTARVAGLITVPVLLWTDESPEGFAFAQGTAHIRRLIGLRGCDGALTATHKARANLVGQGFLRQQFTAVLPVIQGEAAFASRLGSAIHGGVEARLRWKLGNHGIVLFVGRLVAQKGVRTLLRAWEQSESTQGMLLVIVGDGPERRALEKHAERLGIHDKVRFTGMVEGRDLLTLYGLAVLLVLPSHGEPYGAVVDEALLAGVPVVCSRDAGAAELIREGENGYLVRPGDVKGLSQAISRAIVRFAASQGKVERTVLREITLDGVVDDLMDLVQRLRK